MKIHSSCVLGATMFVAVVFAADASYSQVADLGDKIFVPVTQDLTPANEFKKDKPKFTIGVSLPGLFTTWLIQQNEEIRHEASLHPEIGQTIITASDSNAERQAADIEDMLTKGIDALIVSPVSTTAVNAQIDKAVAAGVPVITFSTSASTDKVPVEILQGGAPEGKVMGDWLVKTLGGKGNIWAFRGIAGNSEDTDRYAGLVEALKGTDVKITAEVYAEWNYAKGKQQCESLVLSGQPVDGIWASGGEMTRGCIEVFQEVGKELVPMTGEGNNGFLRVAKEAGSPFVAATYPADLGPVAIRAALALLKGDQLHRKYFGQSIGITKDDVDQYYRPDLNDSYWVQSTIPDDKLKSLYGNK